MAWMDFLAPGVTAAPSPLESTRFGVSVARVSIGAGASVAEFTAALDARHEDVVIVRYAAGRLEIPAWLLRVGRAVVPAGALTYWEKAVGADAAGRALPRGVHRAADLEPAEVEDAIRRVVRGSFADYGNHYSANPLFARAAALAGYEEWAVMALHRQGQEALVLLHDGSPAGMATVECQPGADHLEILLAGLVPEAQGRGLYPPLLDACEVLAAAQGVPRVVISTQAHNTRPQRAWARAGYRPFGAVETVHLVRPGLM